MLSSGALQRDIGLRLSGLLKLRDLFFRNVPEEEPPLGRINERLLRCGNLAEPAGRRSAWERSARRYSSWAVTRSDCRSRAAGCSSRPSGRCNRCTISSPIRRPWCSRRRASSRPFHLAHRVDPPVKGPVCRDAVRTPMSWRFSSGRVIVTGRCSSTFFFRLRLFRPLLFLGRRRRSLMSRRMLLRHRGLG